MSDPLGFTVIVLCIFGPVFFMAIMATVGMEREKGEVLKREALLKAENVYLKRRLRKTRKRLSNANRLRRSGDSAICVRG